MAKPGENTENDDHEDDGEKMSSGEIKKLIVSTVRDHVGRAIGKIDLKGMIGEALGPVAEQLQQVKPGDADKDKGGGVAPEVKQQLDALAAENKKLKDKWETAERQAKEQRERTRRKEERDHLEAALRKAGISNETLVKAAVAHLHGELGRVRRASDEDDTIVWSPGKDEEPLELAKGVAGWLKTDEGRAFLPARPGGGSGAGRGGQLPPGRQNGQRNRGEEIMDDLAVIAEMAPPVVGGSGQ